MERPKLIQEQFTTIDGIVAATVTSNWVSITLHHDDGSVHHIMVPACKFGWVVEAYNKLHA